MVTKVNELEEAVSILDELFKREVPNMKITNESYSRVQSIAMAIALIRTFQSNVYPKLSDYIPSSQS